MVNVQKLLATSKFSGFKNYSTGTATGTLPSTSIAAGGFLSTVISMALNNTNAISSAKIAFPIVETFERQLFGYINTGNIGGVYSLQAQSYYSGGNLNVLVLEVNATGGAVVPPAQTINIQARLYRAPFN